MPGVVEVLMSAGVHPEYAETVRTYVQGLPGGVFRKGILRSYLSVLELDEASWVERFEANLRESGVVSPDGNEWAEFAENVQRNRISTTPMTSTRWMGVGMMLVSLVVLGWVVWKFALHGRLL